MDERTAAKVGLKSLLMKYDHEMTAERAAALREAAGAFDGPFAEGMRFAAELLDTTLRGSS